MPTVLFFNKLGARSTGYAPLTILDFTKND